jgi:selenium-binding protein 1
MVSQSWDGKRVYFTSSLLSPWDGTGHEDEQFLRAFGWDGKALAPAFSLDFRAAKLGRPHIMHFGQQGFFAGRPRGGEQAERAARAQPERSARAGGPGAGVADRRAEVGAR